MNEDRHSVSAVETNDINVDDFSVFSSQIPQTSGTLALAPSHGMTADHPDCGTPPECLPVSPAAGSITSLINFSALNEERIRLRKSYQCIADGVKLSKATVSRFFAGQTPNPSLYNAILIFGFLGLSLDEAAGFKKPVPPPPVETNHELLRKLDHLGYVVTVKDEHIANLQTQLADAVTMRDKYKTFFTDEADRLRTHYESEIDKIRARADKQFRLMFTLVLIILSVLIFYVLTDLCLADRGLFQYNSIL